MASTTLGLISAGLRRERERVGMSLTTLAKRAGVAKSTLSQLEAGHGNPSIKTLSALAEALDIPFTQVVTPPFKTVHVIKASTELPAQTESDGELLASCPFGARRDLFRMRLRSGHAHVAEAGMVGSVEHVIVACGSVKVGPIDHTVELACGDYATYSSDVVHVFEAFDRDAIVTVVVESR